MTRLLPPLLLAVHAWSASAAPLKATTDPPQVVLGKGLDVVTINVEGLSGEGKVYADASVGTVERVDPAGRGLKIRYRPPEQSYPQTLCLLLWREGGAVQAVRLPLLGRTRVPVKTRKHAVVRVRVAGEEFGPFPTGASGRVKVPVQVPPGAKMAMVEVTDNVGMQSVKRVAIRQPRYNQLALSISPRTIDSTSPARFRIGVAVADPDLVEREPVLEVEDRSLRLKPDGVGLWSAVWAPEPRPTGSVTIRASIPGDGRSVREASVDISAGEIHVSVRRVRPRPVVRPKESRLQGDLGVALGMTHSLGDMVAPRLGVELGIEYRLPTGLLGLRLFTGYGWATQVVVAEGGLGVADSIVMLIPVGAGLSYRAPLRYLTPYVMWGCMAQIVRTSTSAPYLEPERSRTDVAFGVLGLLGASRALGPGRLFVQLGYQWSRVENEDVEVLAGGVVLEGGYRLEL
jgi:hypothetical protein